MWVFARSFALINIEEDSPAVSRRWSPLSQSEDFSALFSQGLIHVGAYEKIFNECVSQNCESQPIVYNYFLILYDPT